MLCQSCARKTSRSHLGRLHSGGVCAWCLGLAAYIFDSAVSEPLPSGRGAPWFTTSVALVPYPEVVWDVNGYYQAFGVPTHASRAEIGRAYQNANGQNDVWLTMAVKVLLGGERAVYDATPLGRLYVDDTLREAYRRYMVQRMAQTFSELGIRLDEAQGVVDTGASNVIDCSDTTNDLAWCRWNWRSARSDTSLLSLWRNALLTSLAQHQLPPLRLALGWQGAQSQRVVLTELGDGVIGVLVHEAEASPPTSQVTDKVAEHIAAYVAHHNISPYNGG